jgi:molecular chaperone GrpE (heat shock protein)
MCDDNLNNSLDSVGRPSDPEKDPSAQTPPPQPAPENMALMQDFNPAPDREKVNVSLLIQAKAEEMTGFISDLVKSEVQNIISKMENDYNLTAARQAQFDRLYSELEQYRNDILFKSLGPLIRGIIAIHNDLGNLNSSWQKLPREELSFEKFFTLLTEIQEDLTLILDHNGITAFRETGETFNPKKQSLAGKIITSDISQNAKVAESLRPGFARGEFILEKEKVLVYEFSGNDDNNNDNNDTQLN